MYVSFDSEIRRERVSERQTQSEKEMERQRQSELVQSKENTQRL